MFDVHITEQVLSDVFAYIFDYLTHRYCLFVSGEEDYFLVCEPCCLLKRKFILAIYNYMQNFKITFTNFGSGLLSPRQLNNLHKHI